MPADFWANALYSVTPTILVGLVFWFVMRAIIRADRNERSAYAKLEEQERARLAVEDPAAFARLQQADAQRADLAG